MGVLTRRLAAFPALPWRTLGLLLMLLLVLAGNGRHRRRRVLLQQRPAPPFGIAANGLIAYSR
jgi:hypothetical protein